MAEKGSSVNVVDNEKNVLEQRQVDVAVKATRSIVTLLTHIMVGVVVGASFLYALRNGAPTNTTMHHILICVTGYQLLMIEAILAMAPDSWLSTLKLKHKRVIHFVMQVIGSVLAIAGSFIKILDEDEHWKSLHGRAALAAMVFTSVSLVNGVASFYAYEMRRIIPGILSKLTHICFGMVAVLCANISLIDGFAKTGFRTWASSRLADTIIIITSILTVIILINPAITFFNRLRSTIKK